LGARGSEGWGSGHGATGRLAGEGVAAIRRMVGTAGFVAGVSKGDGERE
jgi:hypothetical protein